MNFDSIYLSGIVDSGHPELVLRALLQAGHVQGGVGDDGLGGPGPAVPDLPLLHHVVLHGVAAVAPGPGPLDRDGVVCGGQVPGLAGGTGRVERVLGLDALVGVAGLGDAVLVLGEDAEVVLLVEGEVPHAGVGGGAVAADLLPVAGALLALLHDVVGDLAAAVVERRGPVEVEGLASEVRAVDASGNTRKNG